MAEFRPVQRFTLLLLLTLLASACSNETTTPIEGELPPISEAEFVEIIETSDQPMVVNLWASWCVPCRSEAPLLVEAHAGLGSEVRFIGIASEDTQADAVAFASEFALPFDNYFDPDAEIRSWIGSAGLPTTFFIAPGGEVVSTVFGVIDERRLALEIDDLLRR